MTTARERRVVWAAVSTMIAAVTVLSATAVAGWWKLRAASAPSYAAGDRIDLPPDLYLDAERTLVLFVRESCAVCQDEAPRLEGLVRRVSAGAQPTAAIVVTVSTRVDAERAFAARLGGATHRHLSSAGLRVKTVPTVVLVDRQGTILFAREGRLSDSEMEELIRRTSSR